MSLTYLKYGKQLTVTFPIFLMKWKRQSSIFWLNIIYIRTKGILPYVRLPKMSRATAQQILVMLLPTPKVKKEWCPHPTFLKRRKRSGEVSNVFFNTPSDTPFYLSVEHQAFMEEKGNRKREEDLTQANYIVLCYELIDQCRSLNIPLRTERVCNSFRIP